MIAIQIPSGSEGSGRAVLPLSFFGGAKFHFASFDAWRGSVSHGSIDVML